MTASTDIIDGDHELELVVSEASAVPSSDDGIVAVSASEEIAPLLNPAEKPKINIFSVSHSRRKPIEQLPKLPETETSPLVLCMLWIWGGSRYSGILCVALSSALYFVMEVLSESFFVRPIPLFETAFTRCTVALILSYVWLRRSGQPIFGAAHARKLLFLRSLMGYLSLLSFIYGSFGLLHMFCLSFDLTQPNWLRKGNRLGLIKLLNLLFFGFVQRLPFSQAIVLNFTTPIAASIAARIILREKLKISDIGGLACSFFGVLFIYRQMLSPQGVLIRAGETNKMIGQGSYHVYAVLIGLLSSITGGISYCLIKAGAKASDQPVATVFSFGLLSSPAAGICTFAFEEFVVPDFSTFLLMLLLGVLAFFVEVLLARGLQLEKTSKAANVQYIEVALSQLWGIGTSRISSSFGGVVGCLLILISVACTVYIGPDKEME